MTPMALPSSQFRFFRDLLKKHRGPVFNHTTFKHSWNWSSWSLQTVARERPSYKECCGIGEGHRWIRQHTNPSWLADVLRSSDIWPESIRLQRPPVFVGAGASTEPVATSEQKTKGVPICRGPICCINICRVKLSEGSKATDFVRKDILMLKLLAGVDARACLGIRGFVTALSLTWVMSELYRK